MVTGHSFTQDPHEKGTAMAQLVRALALRAQLKIITAALYLSGYIIWGISHLRDIAATLWSRRSSQYYPRAGREQELVVSSPIPEDVIVDILVRLPVKSLIRFRSVCKPWRAVIDSSYFIKQHLLRPDHRNSYGCLIVNGYPDGNNECCLLSGHQFEKKSVCLDPSTYGSLGLDPRIELASSCNGIILLVNHYSSGSRKLHAALWNPATKQVRRLQKAASCSTKNLARFSLSLGFGYCDEADDYKVVKISQFSDEHRVEVYSLQTDIWRSVDADLIDGSCIYGHAELYWNGHCCWVSRKQPPAGHSILSFDLSGEVFKITPLPDVLTTPFLTSMGEFIACISTISTEGNFWEDDIYVWVMKEYGVKESWTKVHTIRGIKPVASVYWNKTQVRACLRPEGFSNNGELLLFITVLGSRCPLVLCDPKTQERKCLPINAIMCEDVAEERKGILFRCEDVVVYKESLVSVRNSFQVR